MLEAGYAKASEIWLLALRFSHSLERKHIPIDNTVGSMLSEHSEDTGRGLPPNPDENTEKSSA